MSAEGGIPFGSYALTKRIARGGMAEVFLARQRHMEGYDRRVAVKRILPHLSDSAEFVRMFLGEARLAARLTHPNIVHIYDFGKVGDEYYIAMEFVDGVHAGQLIKHARDEALPSTLVARIGADAAAALHYAHNFTDGDGKPLRLVHRDVSPPNLMVSFDGVVKLVDFGIAKAATIEQRTNPGTVKGKYAYMSPEQTTASALDGRSDVFSLGLVLWELIAGRNIVERGNPVDAMRAIRDGKLPRIESVVPSVPRELVHALELALETDRDDRASALELSQILEAYLKASPDLTTPVQVATWLRARFAPSASGSSPQMADGGTRVVTQGSSAAASVITPGGRESADLTEARASLHDEVGDTIFDGNGTIGGASSGIVDHSTIDEDHAETRLTDSGRDRARSGTRPPPTPRRAHPPTPSDLDNAETIAMVPGMRGQTPPAGRLPLPVSAADRPTAVHGEVRVPTGPRTPLPAPLPAPLPQPAPPVATGTQTNTPALPLADATLLSTERPSQPSLIDRSAGRIDKLIGLTRMSPRRRAAVATIAGGVSAALLGIVCVGLNTGDDKPAAAAVPDAVPVVATIDAVVVDAAPIVTELRVVTHPDGALARVGDRRGQTPITFTVEPGVVTVHLELEGHVPVERTVTLVPGGSSLIELTLDAIPIEMAPDTIDPPPDRDRDRRKKPGKLTVRTTPYSDVYLGKRLLRQTPFADLELPAGPHTLTFKHPGRRTVTRRVVISAGKTTKLNFNLP